MVRVGEERSALPGGRFGPLVFRDIARSRMDFRSRAADIDNFIRLGLLEEDKFPTTSYGLDSWRKINSPGRSRTVNHRKK
jgi:hypothetical protein